MQAECEDVWRQMALAKVGKGEPPGDTGDFGWIGPWRETMKLCQDVIMSDYKVWPEAGGWLDQPEWFREDFKTFMRGLARQMHVVQLEIEAGGSNVGKDDHEPIPSWTELE